MIQTIAFRNKNYPLYQASGNASRFIIPFAKEICHGTGFDIGFGKEEWKYPGAIGIDPIVDNRFDAMRLPDMIVDYIFSSHCLEHIKESWDKVLDYWLEHLKTSGVMFLYLPHPDQEYWLPWNDDKHIHIFHPNDVRRYFESGSYCNVFVSERDLNHSFAVMAQKL